MTVFPSITTELSPAAAEIAWPATVAIAVDIGVGVVGVVITVGFAKNVVLESVPATKTPDVATDMTALLPDASVSVAICPIVAVL